MTNFWLKIRFWSKVIGSGLLILYLIVFVAKNSGTPVKVWFWFGNEPETSLIPLVLWAFGTGVVGTILVRTTFNTLRQFRQMRDRSRTDKLEREREGMRSKAARLRTRPDSDDPDAAVR